ncbi:MAG TPA: hypothetical protein VHC94_10845 [Nitrobacter sp.]|nr:hypothetical protein [Nitrobacter sp.]
MLVERNVRAMNVETIGEAYAIAANYLRGTGAIPETVPADERLLTIIIDAFDRGERNRLKLANRAIARFQTLFVESH